MKIKKSYLKKLIVIASLGVALWGVVAWLFITVPLFVVNALPDLLPLSVFAFLLFLAGLLLLTITAASVSRSIAPRFTWTVVLVASSIIVLYNLSPLAPAWKCFGKRLYVATANAAGQNCTTVCTNNKKKPCGGWSSCWNKDISCSGSGIDQDGRPCQGCCFSCDVVCEPEPDPDQPPTIASSITCSQWGSNGWCVGAETLNLTASDPQGYTLTISGSIGGTAFTCATGNTCSKPLPDGNGAISYTVTASQSGKTASGSTTWKRDTTAPIVTPGVPSPTGLNGWFVTSPVSVSVGGSDAISGLASAQISVNGGAWQSSASLTADGVYSISLRAVDNAGNTTTVVRTVSIDKTAPAVNFSVSGTSGASSWFVSQATVSANATDATSGVNAILISDNGGAGQASPVTLGDGVHNLTITAIDNAGNSKSVSQTVYVDTKGPVISPSVAGSSGTNGWYVSLADVSATASDAGSGQQGNVEVSLDNGTSWTDLPVQLSDGTHPLIFRAYDKAGNVSTSSLNVNVDTMSPSFTTSTAGTAGNVSWYLSTATTTIAPSDALSGVDHIEYNQNGAGWQNGASVTSDDGVNSISIRVYDVAGNMASGSVTVKVDTIRPVITPSISATSGTNGWYVSSGTVSAAVSDTISGVSGTTEVSFDGGSSWKNTPISVSDGVYNMIFRAFDVAGNESGASLSASIDTTKPNLNFVFDGTSGMNGWYVSTVKVSPSASDALSGVDYSEVRANGGAWSLLQTLSDGVHDLEARSGDLAGNIKSISGTLRIDTKLPTSLFTIHTNNEVVSGIVTLSGQSSDLTSGLQSAEISLDGGATWKTAMLSGGVWSHEWDTKSVPNGIYTVQMRAVDMAGNKENPIKLTLLADNFPPNVKITDSWWIWESGTIKVSANGFPISEIKVTISDPKGRWPSVVFTYNPSTTSSDVTWDRRFSDGTIAPSGNYHVTVSACDIYGNCSSDWGVINIPFIAPIPPTATPSPVPSPTLISTITAVSSPIPHVQTVVPQTPLVDNVEPVREQPIVEGYKAPVFPILAVVSLIALMWALSSAALADPRPKAILEIAKTISQKRIM